ncbi:MAG: ligand-binding sensor domain-containing protein [Paraglaciecola sp.]|jgi:ligand-binding sensor domain-containing protein
MKNIFTILLAIVTFQLQAQTFTNYTVDDGLINNSVNCVAVDADDNVWFGTQNGISFFDGISWTNYDTDSHPDLVNDDIKAVAIDNDGNLWFGTDFGISKYDFTTWTTYTDDDGLADNRVRYINQAPDGKMWFGNNDGVSNFDGTTWTSYVQADGLPFGGVNHVTFENDGTAWLGTALGGVFIFDGTGFTTITEEEGLLSDKIRSIAIAENNQKWIGSADGITVLSADNSFLMNHEIIFELPPPDELNPVEDVQIDSHGRIWASVYVDYLVTEGGVSMYDGFDWIDYDVEDGLVGPVVRRLAIDTQDNVWVTTSTGVTKIGDVPVAIFEVEIDNGIEIYPNPVSDMLTLQVPNELKDTPFQIYNNIGQLVKTGPILNEKMTLEMDFPKGVYALTINGIYTRKVVIL